ncbi:hypothetical protein [Solitalea canadensis]|uniref:Uncharacterized protein n=1 Tax=Solitalea canadensis (strain ATCC 29591 / DSM 3403 / JCM 21819 / LMG 8368 / NBRC 15130 / NCIMB 12057 / USAM 9D) TaxID=929556 RepID=H8KW56_SOLCM|nr:hypothetical protein [Solitalea canadensis]AFD07077.1 hypothetical protein Solca_2022 [Solitalea canadensis DSM 3403]
MEEVKFLDSAVFKSSVNPTDPELAKGLNIYLGGCCAFKKCCKKYKKGKACKSCPKH